MKKVTLALGFILAFALGTFAQQQVGGPEITFEKDVHDFGKIKQYGNATTEFVFTNTGNAPLIISNAKGSCGCTVPTWPREPIAPGATAVIKVKYDSKRVGPINKSVTITSNATNAPTKVIRITGNISAAPKETTSPVKKEEAAPTSL
ncbi:DUF1573 domain-containing protein [bacterium SCSIO 12643]|nr:DUF1573 domain-containing protein [bacterium SCSIO 12643]